MGFGIRLFHHLQDVFRRNLGHVVFQDEVLGREIVVVGVPGNRVEVLEGYGELPGGRGPHLEGHLRVQRVHVIDVRHPVPVGVRQIALGGQALGQQAHDPVDFGVQHHAVDGDFPGLVAGGIQAQDHVLGCGGQGEHGGQRAAGRNGAGIQRLALAVAQADHDQLAVGGLARQRRRGAGLLVQLDRQVQRHGKQGFVGEGAAEGPGHVQDLVRRQLRSGGRAEPRFQAAGRQQGEQRYDRQGRDQTSGFHLLPPPPHS